MVRLNGMGEDTGDLVSLLNVPNTKHGSDADI